MHLHSNYATYVVKCVCDYFQMWLDQWHPSASSQSHRAVYFSIRTSEVNFRPKDEQDRLDQKTKPTPQSLNQPVNGRKVEASQTIPLEKRNTQRKRRMSD